MTARGSAAGDVIATDRLRLEPLRGDHAAEMVPVLADIALYEFTGGTSPSTVELERRYAAQIAGPADGSERWRNWIIRRAEGGAPIGYVQATIVADAAEIAWLVGTAHQGHGYATEAAHGMVDRLVADGVRHLSAHVHPEHVASQTVAARIGLSATGEVDEDGESIWRCDVRAANTTQ